MRFSLKQETLSFIAGMCPLRPRRAPHQSFLFFYGFFPGRRAAVQKRRRPGGISVRLPPLPKEPFVRNPEPSRERNPRGTCRGCTGSVRWRGMEGVCL